MWIQLPTGAEVRPSSEYPNDWVVQQAIAEVYNSFGVMTYCKRKTLRKFGQTNNADNGVATTVAIFYNDEVNETFSTSNDIDRVVSSSADDTETLIIEGHYYDVNNRKLFHVQEVTLTGQTPVALSQSLCRATRYKIKKGTFASPASTLAGNLAVYVSSGTTVTNGVVSVSDDTKVKLYGSTNQSEKCASALSYYDYFVITDVGINAAKASGSTALVDYEVEYREEGGVWLPVGIEGSLRTASQSRDRIEDRPYVFIVPRDSDFRLIVNSDTNDIPVKGFINGFLLNDIEDPNSALPIATKNKIRQSMLAA